MTTDATIPRCWVISLPEAADRRKQIERTFGEAGVKFAFETAVDGRTVNPDSYVDADLVRQNIGRDLSAGEIGCSLSHRRLYRQILNEPDLPGAFIFEDDVTVSPNINSVLSAVLEMVGNGNDSLLVHLTGQHMLRYRDILLSARHRQVGDGFVLERYLRGPEVIGTWGYFITRAAAALILSREPRLTNVADAWKRRLLNGTIHGIYLMTPDAVHHPEHAQGSGIERERAALSGVPGEQQDARSRAVRAAKRLIYPVVGRLL